MVHPSKMDKRTKEYKDWAAKEAAAVAKPAPEAEPQEPVEAVDGPIEQQVARVVDGPQEPREDIVIDTNHKEPMPAKVARKPTKPWERMAANRPWRRDYFKLERKHAGFRCRFVDPANVEARLQKGYQVAAPENYGGLVDSDIRDSGGLGKHITRHGMVLMEIPEEGAQAYERQNEEMIQSRYRSTKAELEQAAREAGTKVTIQAEGFK